MRIALSKMVFVCATVAPNQAKQRPQLSFALSLPFANGGTLGKRSGCHLVLSPVIQKA
jgi:hypothetical protein